MVHKPAPGNLEIVRTFLNTWSIPNETRVPTDLLSDEDDIREFINFNNLKKITDYNLNEVISFRNDIREAIEGQDGSRLLSWLAKYPVQAKLSVQDATLKTIYQAENGGSFINQLLSIIVKAVALGHWDRLKACPDCRYAFYDHSKNGSKKWCGMYAETSKGRACGTIHKVKRYRERAKNKE